MIFMKVAIAFDFAEGRSGGEKIVSFLAKRYNADIYIGYANWNKIIPDFKNFNVNIIGNIPKIPIIKQELLVRKFRNLNLSNYDVTICLGYYSIYSSIKNHPLIWYAYGPSSLFYKKPSDTSLRVSLTWKIGALIWKKRIQNYDKKVVKKHIDKIIVISKYASQSLKDCYGVDSLIVNPPTDTKKFFYKPHKGYYLIVSRFEPGKRVEIAIEAFKKMPNKILFIEGSGSTESYLRNLASGSKNIKFLGRVHSLEDLANLYANCIALIGTAFYDEWSMPMVEAMASGKPCISVNQGAYPEIIINNKTGILVEGTPVGIIDGVNKITPEVAEKMKKNCIDRAKDFDINVFYKKWDGIIKSVVKHE